MTDSEDQVPVEESRTPLTTADIASGAESKVRAEQRSFDAASTASPEPDAGPLFQPADADGLRRRWADIQAGFVDEPRRAVEQADSLVAESIKRLAQLFAEERAQLEGQWDRGDDVSTEDLRQALRRYRSFFSRLLAV
jgi:hypothetical protein